jgi:type VI secretion system secreted protein Hcp
MPIYMKYDGIDGAVTSAGFDKWIELESCQMGVNRNISSGAKGNRESSTPSFSDISITKHQDAASTGLFTASLFGEGKKVDIAFTKTGLDGSTQQKYLEITLTNALISSFSTSGHGGDASGQPMEMLSINFTKIEWKHTATDQNNKAAKPTVASWDLAAGKKA